MTILERAARAVCAEHAMHDPDMMVAGRDGGSVPYWTEFVRDARAVLQAIREPSEAMQVAASKPTVSFSASGMIDSGRVLVEYPDEPDKGAATVWQAMVDAALAETETTN